MIKFNSNLSIKTPFGFSFISITDIKQRYRDVTIYGSPINKRRVSHDYNIETKRSATNNSTNKNTYRDVIYTRTTSALHLRFHQLEIALVHKYIHLYIHTYFQLAISRAGTTTDFSSRRPVISHSRELPTRE